MKKSIVLLTITLLLSLSLSAGAQFVENGVNQAESPSLGLNPAQSAFSLIDLSRVRWSHSYSVSFFSGQSYSGSVGLLSSSMFYDISPKLSLALNVGVVHNAGAIWGDQNNNATILPGFRLDYRPSEKFQMSLIFQRSNGQIAPRGLWSGSLFSPWHDWQRGNTE
jgi:hypothetical protein